MHEVSRAFRAMGSDCSIRLVVDGGAGEAILERAIGTVTMLERRWSRFIADSELSQLNAHAGAPVFVSPETFEIVSLAVEAWRVTGGLFDPTMLDALIDVGYDTDFDELARRKRSIDIGHLHASEGPAGVELDGRSRMIITPPGLHLDLGGIGKGHAADCVFEQVMGEGVVGACLDMGGDVRVGGATIGGGGWAVVIDDPFRPGEDLAVLGVGEGSVTTSSRLRRRWSIGSGEAHHILDPATSSPSASDLASVTVVASRASWGEVYAKAALVAGIERGAALIESAGLSALFVGGDGDTTPVGAFDAFLAEGPTLGP